MIKKCKQCGISYNNETIKKCPVCFFHKESKEKGKGIIHVLTKELRKCVNLSRKGKYRKPPSGMHIIGGKKKSSYIPKKEQLRRNKL